MEPQEPVDNNAGEQTVEHIPDDAPTTPLETRSEASPSSQEFVRTIGAYEIIGVLGQGGMGVVYKARQVRLNRIVALKTIRRIANADSDLASRFRIEAEATARLTHENIVPVIDFFEEGGSYFLVLGFVDGVDLESKLKAGPMNCREAARVVLQIAQAIEFAHQHGVIHRDLKPANVLIDSAGICRVSDFGLAKLTAASDNLTVTGDILGTPVYMSPEQASGNSEKTTIAVDVYSLGAILYRCVSGRPPFSGTSAMEVLSKVRSDEAKVPSLYAGQVDQDIDTICLKCLEKDPTQRYRSANELAQELSRYLNGEPIFARPISSIAKVIRYCKRKPAEFSLAVAVSVALILGVLLLSLWFNRWESNLFAQPGIHSGPGVLLVLASFGPVFSVCRALGPERLRRIETRLLRAGRAVLRLTLVQGVLTIRFLLLMLVVGSFKLLSKTASMNDDQVLLQLIFVSIQIVISFLLLYYLGWKKRMVLLLVSTLALFGVIYILESIYGNELDIMIENDLAVLLWVLPVLIPAFLVQIWIMLTAEYSALIKICDAMFLSAENAKRQIFGFTIIPYRDYRIGVLGLLPFLLFQNLLVFMLFVALAAVMLPFLVAERLRRVLTPETPVFMDLLAYGVSIVTLVVLGLSIFWGRS